MYSRATFPKDEINPEIKGKLDAIGRVAEAAGARG